MSPSSICRCMEMASEQPRFSFTYPSKRRVAVFSMSSDDETKKSSSFKALLALGAFLAYTILLGLVLSQRGTFYRLRVCQIIVAAVVG